MIQFNRPDADSPQGSSARYQPGDLVRHRRHGYRGVVVALDPDCRASEDWYQNNKTQPDRDQPWYHVLVHDAFHTTYAAQSSLLADPGGEEVAHPLIAEFFGGFKNGYYIRNDTPWPS